MVNIYINVRWKEETSDDYKDNLEAAGKQDKAVKRIFHRD